ncbi:protein MIS12 homolog isoform X1 [Corythoichthys intestinalis]|uniref:protein MIS12 homolog isoform X1 n=1 Tax=Corythoichthys intestinalis TaxID=161448 RepID=UPI0025A59B63|nr:protein MIS12 homolog isoform X1 [Corythoichthys intestinalis]
MDVKDVSEENDCFPESTLEIYETQFFGYTPQTFMFRLSSAFMESLCNILSVVERVCVRQLNKGKSDAAKEEQLRVQARKCSSKLQAFVRERFKQLSERMETMIVSRCFAIPPNVLLKEDELHKNHPSNTQEMLRLESSLAELRKTYKAEVCARHALQSELEEQEAVQKQLDRFLDWIGVLQVARLMRGVDSVQESSQLVMASVQKLQKSILESTEELRLGRRFIFQQDK